MLTPFVVVCLLALLACTAASTNPPAINLPAWSYECQQNRCVKVLVPQPPVENSTTIPVSLGVCRLLCPRQPGTVWPLVRGTLRLSDSARNQQLAAVDPAAVHISAKVVARHPDFWLLNGERLQQQLRNKVPASLPHDVKSAIGAGGQAVKITIEVSSSNCAIWQPELDESYRAEAAESAADQSVHVKIAAKTIFGARHALETLSQLVVYDDVTGRLLMPTEWLVEDAPAFAHRGLLLDTARNYYSVEAIKRTIDAMAMTKLNTFHWHITDSHSFPLALKRHPDFARLGAYAPSKVYTPDAIADVLAHAYVRGVRVLPEFDAPAHVGEGWQLTNLTVCFNQQPWAQFCVEPPCGQLNPTRPELYPILGDIYKEMFELFGAPGMFHMGGDEVSVKCWNTSAEIRDWMRARQWSDQREADFMRLWGHFQSHALEQVDAAALAVSPDEPHQLPIVLWTSRLTDVPFIDDYLDPQRYIIQIWTTGVDPKIRDLLDRGFKLIMSNYDALYFDCGFGGWVQGGQNWCAPYIGWERVYGNDWRDVANRTATERREQILGAEAALWSEQADDLVLDGRFWPRASALAERLWSDPEALVIDDGGRLVKAWRAAEARMLVHRERLAENGVRVESLQPQWCQQNEGECPLV